MKKHITEACVFQTDILILMENYPVGFHIITTLRFYTKQALLLLCCRAELLGRETIVCSVGIVKNLTDWNFRPDVELLYVYVL